MSLFLPNPNFARELSASDGVHSMLDKLGATAAGLAREHAPHLTGHLAESVGYAVGANDQGVTIARVYAKDFKAPWHEKGTSKMAAHPFLEPAVAETIQGAR